MQRKKLLTIAWALVAVVILAACGSSSGGSPSTPTSSTSSTGTIASTTPIKVTKSVIPVGNPETATTQPMPAASKATGSPIKIGFPYADWAALKATGYPVQYRTDDSQQITAMVNWANAHGGIDGHVIAPVKLDVNIVDPNAAQAACLTLTQQDKVFQVIDVTALTSGNTSQNCVMIQNKTAMTNIYPGANSDYLARKVEMSPVATLEQEGTNLIVAGDEEGFFKIPGKLGILRDGCDPSDVWSGPDSITTLLKSAGVKSSDIVQFADKCSAGSNSEAPAALLQMKSAGVTHIIGGTGSALETGFTVAAQKEGYHPAWLLGDFDSTLLNYALLNPDNISNAYGVSGTRMNYENDPQAATCDSAYKAGGLPGLRKEEVDLVAGYLCQEVVDAVQIGKLVKGPLTQASFLKAAGQSGNLFSPQTFGTTYVPGGLLGDEKVGLMRFSASQDGWILKKVVTAPSALAK